MTEAVGTNSVLPATGILWNKYLTCFTLYVIFDPLVASLGRHFEFGNASCCFRVSYQHTEHTELVRHAISTCRSQSTAPTRASNAQQRYSHRGWIHRKDNPVFRQTDYIPADWFGWKGWWWENAIQRSELYVGSHRLSKHLFWWPLWIWSEALIYKGSHRPNFWAK